MAILGVTSSEALAGTSTEYRRWSPADIGGITVFRTASTLAEINTSLAAGYTTHLPGGTIALGAENLAIRSGGILSGFRETTLTDSGTISFDFTVTSSGSFIEASGRYEQLHRVTPDLSGMAVGAYVVIRQAADNTSDCFKELNNGNKGPAQEMFIVKSVDGTSSASYDEIEIDRIPFHEYPITGTLDEYGVAWENDAAVHVVVPNIDPVFENIVLDGPTLDFRVIQGGKIYTKTDRAQQVKAGFGTAGLNDPTACRDMDIDYSYVYALGNTSGNNTTLNLRGICGDSKIHVTGVGGKKDGPDIVGSSGYTLTGSVYQSYTRSLNQYNCRNFRNENIRVLSSGYQATGAANNIEAYLLDYCGDYVIDGAYVTAREGEGIELRLTNDNALLQGIHIEEDPTWVKQWLVDDTGIPGYEPNKLLNIHGAKSHDITVKGYRGHGGRIQLKIGDGGKRIRIEDAYLTQSVHVTARANPIDIGDNLDIYDMEGITLRDVKVEWDGVATCTLANNDSDIQDTYATKAALNADLPSLGAGHYFVTADESEDGGTWIYEVQVIATVPTLTRSWKASRWARLKNLKLIDCNFVNSWDNASSLHYAVIKNVDGLRIIRGSFTGNTHGDIQAFSDCTDVKVEVDDWDTGNGVVKVPFDSFAVGSYFVRDTLTWGAATTALDREAIAAFRRIDQNPVPDATAIQANESVQNYDTGDTKTYIRTNDNDGGIRSIETT